MSTEKYLQNLREWENHGFSLLNPSGGKWDIISKLKAWTTFKTHRAREYFHGTGRVHQNHYAQINFLTYVCIHSWRKLCKKPKEIYFEFTSSGTTQKIGVKEWEFVTLYFFMQASMAHTSICNNLNTDLCPEYAATMNKFKFFSKPNQICLMRSSTVRLHTMQNI